MQVPAYREKTLTYVLQDVLGGNSKCMVIVTGVLSSLQYKPTQGALDFGNTCKNVKRSVTAPRKQLTHLEMEERMRWYRDEVCNITNQMHLYQ